MVLYEYKIDLFNILFDIAPLVVLSFGFAFFSIKNHLNGSKCISLILSSATVIIFLVMIAIISFDISANKQYSTIMKNQTYQTVTGYVEDFHPATQDGAGAESFIINEIYFRYAQNDTYIGYHRVSTKGGVITGNSQFLTIDYVYDETIEENVILRITQET